MRAFTLSLLPAAILFNGALATWNDKICEGAGGCLGITWFPNTDYTCPGDILITNQEVAQNLISTESGVYTVISADEFPDSCEKESPDSNDYLVAHTSDDATYYGFITENCFEEAPEPDCYSQNPNNSGLTLCHIAVTATGEFCTQKE